MFFVFLGCFSFLLYILYDLNQIKKNSPIFRTLFLIASILLIFSTVVIAINYRHEIAIIGYLQIIGGIGSFVGFIFLVYSLFFALPFHDTYVEGSGLTKVYDRGMYALCRHPGVLWFIVFYGFLWLPLESLTMLFAGIAFSLGNVIYIILQDYYFFPRLFEGYAQYRHTTPFLFPTYASCCRCCRTLKK